MEIIARIRNDYTGKFGIPRQAGLVEEVRSTIVFEKPYRNRDALRGIEGYSHLWLLWLFSENRKTAWEPTVRPPKLGGNRRMGVFATRSPYRPNPIGLSAVRLIGLHETKDDGTVIEVCGADLMNGTPIVDIKPYLPYTDAYPNARAGLLDETDTTPANVDMPEEIAAILPENKRFALLAMLREDPRPGYQLDEKREYGFSYGSYEVHFCAQGKQIQVTSIEEKRGDHSGME